MIDANLRAEQEQRKLDHPNCYFTRIIRDGIVAIVAIPIPKVQPPRGGIFDCPELFHGATIRLKGIQ